MSHKQTRGGTRDGTLNADKTKNKLSNVRSAEKIRQTDHQNMHKQSVNNQSQAEDYGEPMDSKFSRECINDYIKITQYRAR